MKSEIGSSKKDTQKIILLPDQKLLFSDKKKPCLLMSAKQHWPVHFLMWILCMKVSGTAKRLCFALLYTPSAWFQNLQVVFPRSLEIGVCVCVCVCVCVFKLPIRVYYFANKGLYSQSYGFSSSHVWMWEPDDKERWGLKNYTFELWCWRRLLRVPRIARRSNQSILKEINPDAEADALLFWPPDAKSLLIGKDSDAKKDWRQEGGEVGNRGWDHWMGASSGNWWRTGKPGVLQSMGSLRARCDWATEQQQQQSEMHPCVLSQFSRVWLFVMPWTIAHQPPLSMRFSKQEYWSGLPCPPPEDLPYPGIEPMSHVSYIGRWVLYQQCQLGSLSEESKANHQCLLGVQKALIADTLFFSCAQMT